MPALLMGKQLLKRGVTNKKGVTVLSHCYKTTITGAVSASNDHFTQAKGIGRVF